MLKKYPILKWSLITFLSLIVSIFTFGYWFMSLIPSGEARKEWPNTRPEDLSYLSQGDTLSRGKILAVVTSHDVMGTSGKYTGYELTELARPYYVFKANGFEVDVASPKGGTPPIVIDGDDMGVFDYAFLNDPLAQRKVNHSIPMEEVIAADYEAVYFVGGKGAMFDFPDNSKIQSLVSEYYQSGKVVGAVCHGPAALVNVTLEDGSSLLDSKTISSFTNEEELLLIPDAENIFPFLLQSKIEEKGAQFQEGIMYLQNVAIDGNLVTGQNPWSIWVFAESMVRQLGYAPVKRAITAEENAITILSTYETKGYDRAKEQIKVMLSTSETPMDRTLIAMHSIVAAMQWKLGKTLDLIGLVSYAKEQSVNE